MRMYTITFAVPCLEWHDMAAVHALEIWTEVTWPHLSSEGPMGWSWSFESAGSLLMAHGRFSQFNDSRLGPTGVAVGAGWVV